MDPATDAEQNTCERQGAPSMLSDHLPMRGRGWTSQPAQGTAQFPATLSQGVMYVL